MHTNIVNFFVRILYPGVIDEFPLVRRVYFNCRGKIINVLNHFRRNLRCFRRIIKVTGISVIFSVLRSYYYRLRLMICFLLCLDVRLINLFLVLGIIPAACRQKQRCNQTRRSQILKLLFHKLRLLFFICLSFLLFSMLIICPGAKKRPTPKGVLG